MKKIIAAEPEDGDVVEFFGGIQWKGYQEKDSEEVGVKKDFFRN
jgi:hypothetical protein